MIEQRKIGMAILLSIVTFGIYFIIWFIKLTNEANQLSGEEKPTGGVAFLLGLVTCGVYNWFWGLNMGKKMDKALVNYGHESKDSSTLYLVLNLVGLLFVTLILIQIDVNNILEGANA